MAAVGSVGAVPAVRRGADGGGTRNRLGVGISPQIDSLAAYKAYLALGGALFLALLLQASCGPASVVAWCGGALATELVVVTIDRAVPALRVQLVVCGGLLLALLIRAGIVLGQTVRHR